MALDNVLDSAGNKYGGATSGLAGEGDIVKDISFSTTALTGTVKKVWIDPINPVANSRALVQINQYLDGNIHEMMVNTRAMTLISHADGGGLVSGGSAAAVPTTVPPTGYNYMDNPVKVV